MKQCIQFPSTSTDSQPRTENTVGWIHGCVAEPRDIEGQSCIYWKKSAYKQTPGSPNPCCSRVNCSSFCFYFTEEGGEVWKDCRADTCECAHLRGSVVHGQALGWHPGDRGFPSGEATNSLGFLKQAPFPPLSHGAKGGVDKSCFSTLAAY